MSGAVPKADAHNTLRELIERVLRLRVYAEDVETRDEAAAELTRLSEENERKTAALENVLAAIKRARDMVPDEEDGLAAQIFAYHLNAADCEARTTLSGGQQG